MRPVQSDVDAAAARAAGGFRLLRHFTIATLLAFVVVAAVLVALQRREERFFDQVQQQQRAFFAQAQSELARQHAAAAMAGLLAVHEAGHISLTRLFANTMWASDIAPFVARVQALPRLRCAASAATPDERSACARQRGARIRALAGFDELDRKAYAAMRGSAVFKIKVFSLDGLTVYSSEHAQIGEDASANAGWRHAAGGIAASELTHRDRFSAFERVVENRDLISSYVPVRRGDGAVQGVVELYSDVTPFLGQIKQAGDRFAAISAANEAEVAGRADQNQRSVKTSSDNFLLIVLGLLATLYAVSLAIVRRGQRLIDRQALAQAQAARRERMWHREKMEALATMAANVSHEVGNPLAVINGIAQELADGRPASGASDRIFEQTRRIAAMTHHISDFASARGADPEWVDVNGLVRAACGFHGFDRRFRATPVVFEPDPQLPAGFLAPDLLNEALLALLQSGSEAVAAAGMGGSVTVRTRRAGEWLAIDLLHEALGPGLEACPRLPGVRDRVAELGGSLVLVPGAVTLRLPGRADA